MNDIPPDDAVEELDISELIDAHLDAQTANEFADDVPTLVEPERLCPGCACVFATLDDTQQPPASHAEAWRPPVCRGNTAWFWCKADGRLVLIGKMAVVFFPDRRLVSRPVDVERRGR